MILILWLSSAGRHLQVLERQVHSAEKFCLTKVSCRRVIVVTLLDCVYCTRLILTRIVVSFSELPSPSTGVRHTRAAVAAYLLEFEVSWCKPYQFAN